MRTSRFLRLLALALAFPLLEGGSLSAQTCSIPSIGTSYSGVFGVHITFSSNFPFIGSLGDAMALWNAGCTTTSGGTAVPGDDYPESDFYYGERDIYFQYFTGHSPSTNCTFNGAQVHCAMEWHDEADSVYVYERWGPPQPGGAPPPYLTSQYPYDVRVGLLAHEMAHAFGLGDTSCGSISNPAAGAGATITGPECNRVDTNHLVPGENTQQDPKDNTGGSPIIIDTLGNGYQLEGLAEAVTFDIDADGDLDRMAWTSPASDDAFLWLDRNHNGLVDDGSELFGDARSENGFEALGVYDAEQIGDVYFGGNENDVIDAGDSVWSELLLWFDRNHDGESSGEEIMPLPASNVVAISLDYRWIGKRDLHGNAFRFRADIFTRQENGRIAKGHVYDVFFVLE